MSPHGSARHREKPSRIVADHDAITVAAEIDDQLAQRAVVEHVVGDDAVLKPW